MCVIAFFVKNQGTMGVPPTDQSSVLSHCSVYLLLLQYHAVFITIGLVCNLKPVMVIPKDLDF